MANPWFRMYSEFATDPKVQMLSEVNQRRFVMLLCLRCSNDTVTLQNEAIAFQLRISDEEWALTKTVLMAENLIDEDNQPENWDKRQYVSDSSAARVAKHRAEKKKNQKQPCNVTVTPPDTDTESESDTNTTRKKVSKSSNDDHFRFEEFYLAYPRKAARAQALKAWNKLKPDETLINLILADISKRITAGEFDMEDKVHIAHPATYLNGQRWNDEIISRGVPHETHKPPGRERELSAVDRLRHANDTGELDEAIRLAEAAEALENGLDQAGGNLWPSVDQSIREADAGNVDSPSDGILVN